MALQSTMIITFTSNYLQSELNLLFTSHLKDGFSHLHQRKLELIRIQYLLTTALIGG